MQSLQPQFYTQDQTSGSRRDHHSAEEGSCCPCPARGPEPCCTQDQPATTLTPFTALPCSLVSRLTLPWALPDPGPVLPAGMRPLLLTPASFPVIIEKRRQPLAGPGQSWGPLCPWQVRSQASSKLSIPAPRGNTHATEAPPISLCHLLDKQTGSLGLRPPVPLSRTPPSHSDHGGVNTLTYSHPGFAQLFPLFHSIHHCNSERSLIFSSVIRRRLSSAVRFISYEHSSADPSSNPAGTNSQSQPLGHLHL